MLLSSFISLSNSRKCWQSKKKKNSGTKAVLPQVWSCQAQKWTTLTLTLTSGSQEVTTLSCVSSSKQACQDLDILNRFVILDQKHSLQSSKKQILHVLNITRRLVKHQNPGEQHPHACQQRKHNLPWGSANPHFKLIHPDMFGIFGNLRTLTRIQSEGQRV